MAHRIFYKTVAYLLSVCLLLLAASELLTGLCGAGQVLAASQINGHSYLTENSSYRLYMREDDLSLVVEDKASGAFMESAISYDDGANNDTWLGAMKSAIVISMINDNDDTKQADLINDDVTKKITYTENGFEAKLYWNNYKFGLTLQVALTEEGLMARIPDESIIEDGNKYFIGTIAMYPYMGTSYLDDKEGYMLVPDGNGALIYLNDKEGRFKSGFSSMIYGSDIGFDESSSLTLLNDKYNTIEDANQIIAPVFGIAHTDDEIAYLAVVEDGEARASIEVIPNGASVNYNRAYTKFILRKLYTQPTSNNSTAGSLHVYESERSHSDLQISYLFLSGEEANYSGMANAYREYLLRHELLRQVDASFKTRVDFLGTERESWVIGTNPVLMTSIEDIYDIYQDLESEGVTDLFSVYKGWQKDGLYHLPITKYQADAKIGGTKELTKLLADTKNKGIDFYLYNNALLINPEEENATFHVVKKINKRRYEEETYMDVYEKLLYVTPERSSTNLSKFLKSYNRQGVNTLAVAGISNTLFSYTYSGETYTRFETQDVYQELMNTAAKENKLVLEQPAAYLWKHTDAFLDMPLYTSSYIYEEEIIPFLSIVLKGVMPVYSEYVNFEANKRELFLKMVETGTFPSFYITKESSSKLLYTNSCDIYSSEYTSYKDTIKEYTNQLKELNRSLDGATITKHEINDNGVVKVTYSNGVKVYVNYSTAVQALDGLQISPMSYEVVNK